MWAYNITSFEDLWSSNVCTYYKRYCIKEKKKKTKERGKPWKCDMGKFLVVEFKREQKNIRIDQINN